MSQKIIFMPHANIQYSQLDPARRAWVCEHCYRPLFELVRDGEYRIAFEASGRTLEVMAGETPEVLALLKELIADGRIEPVGSPFIHVMLANIPPEVALHSLKRGLDAWEAYTGVRPGNRLEPGMRLGRQPAGALQGGRFQQSGHGCRQLLPLFPWKPRSDRPCLRCPGTQQQKPSFQNRGVYQEQAGIPPVSDQSVGHSERIEHDLPKLTAWPTRCSGI